MLHQFAPSLTKALLATSCALLGCTIETASLIVTEKIAVITAGNLQALHDFPQVSGNNHGFREDRV